MRFILENFQSLSLPTPLLKALERLSFSTPTPIQVLAIPPALDGFDILGSAQTGTGKTGAFGIPLITHLMKNPESAALVMTPTRELAVQVIKFMESLLTRNDPIRPALLIGGESIFKQLQQLKMRPRLIVGTPGRINDHLIRGSLRLGETDFLVLDETDRMLDMGFAPQIDRIVQHLPQQRQTLLFSATLPPNIVKMSERYLYEPVRVSAGSTVTPAANIKQEVVRLNEAEKYTALQDQLGSREGSVIIFVKTKWNADKMADKLNDQGHAAEAIHGDLRHSRRERVIRGFRNSEYRILVATDIAARGLDISHVRHVINYDLPQCPEDYIHRIGRTGRAGAEGEAVCFVAPSDRAKWNAIQKLINPDFKPEPRPAGAGTGKNHGPKGRGNFKKKNRAAMFRGRESQRSAA
jgi:ATP-dependent RNA helicase DeaD